jgi:uncharacterized membrane protein
MARNPIAFEVVEGERADIALGGARRRRRTVLIRFGGLSLSKKAFMLGAALVLCQFLDGVLTFTGLKLMGVEMEGNKFLRYYMNQYGLGPVLLAAKSFAVVCAVVLTFHAHERRWIRPLILAVVMIYVGLAVVPWVYFISRHTAEALSLS